MHGLRYFSCRATDRAGIATVAFRKAAIGTARAQHLLVDDALWPYLVHTLDAAGVAVNRRALLTESLLVGWECSPNSS